LVAEETESLTVKNGEMEGIDRSFSQGVGIRVLVNGYWGFAATARTEGAEIERTADLAVSIARAASRLPMEPVRLTDVEPVRGEWSAPLREDPFAVPLGEKVDLLMRASGKMQHVKGLSFAEATLDFYRRRTGFASSEGAAIEQTIVNSGGGIQGTAVADGEVQRRSFPNSFRGHLLAAGYEHIRGLGLEEEAERTAQEAVDLVSASDCPGELTTLVLDSNQVILQVHESVGHPIELDRVLRMEEAYAGTSFLEPGHRGKLRYGSDLVSITADASIPGGLGTFGYDDEGVPAQRSELVSRGTFTGYLTSRETAPAIGRASNGTMRAEGWNRLPLIRMTNVNLEPGEWDFEDLLADTDDGIYMATNRSWSIDDRRLNFQFGTEIAWEVRGGKLGRMLKNPTYSGITPQLWSSCDAVCSREHWKLWGVPNCGKGEPMQVIHVGHGAAPARFRDVQVRPGA
jgi:TldD protein